jgi:hypothetical protein
MLEHRKNDEGFPVPRANHQRIVCAMAFSSEVDTGSRQENASEGGFGSSSQQPRSNKPQKQSPPFRVRNGGDSSFNNDGSFNKKEV